MDEIYESTDRPTERVVKVLHDFLPFAACLPRVQRLLHGTNENSALHFEVPIFSHSLVSDTLRVFAHCIS